MTQLQQTEELHFQPLDRQGAFYYCYPEKAAGPLKNELGNPAEGSQVLSKDQDPRDPLKYLLTCSVVRNTCQGPYRPARQAGHEYSQSDTFAWHKGLQATPGMEPPLHVCAVGELGIGCVSQHQTSVYIVSCSPSVEKIEQLASLSLTVIEVSSGCSCSCRKLGACFPDSLQVRRVFYFENFIPLPHSQ